MAILAVLSAMLLASVLPVAFWAKTAGYFEIAGPLLLGSLERFLR